MKNMRTKKLNKNEGNLQAETQNEIVKERKTVQ